MIYLYSNFISLVPQSDLEALSSSGGGVCVKLPSATEKIVTENDKLRKEKKKVVVRTCTNTHLEAYKLKLWPLNVSFKNLPDLGKTP